MRSDAEILLSARKKLGMTQQQVADKAKIAWRQYHRFESGERRLMSASFELAADVLMALELDVDDFAHGRYAATDDE